MNLTFHHSDAILDRMPRMKTYYSHFLNCQTFFLDVEDSSHVVNQ